MNLKQDQNLETSAIPVTLENQAYCDFHLLMASLPHGEGAMLEYCKEVGIYIHPMVGCWFECKFVLIFENVVYFKADSRPERLAR